MDIRQLRYLLALSRERHFARAAAACAISQPTLSARIRQLEDELGVALVERGQRFMGFTPEGERVLERARRIVADCDAMAQDLGAMRRDLTGSLALGAIPTVLPMVAGLTATFAERHPNVALTVLSMSSREIQRGLDAFELQAGLTYLEHEPLHNVRRLRLYDERYVLLAPVDGRLSGLLKGRDAIDWREAADLPLCLLTPDMQNRRIVDEIFASVGRPVAPGIVTDALWLTATHVRTGCWAAVVPAILAAEPGIAHGLRALALTGAADTLAVQPVGLVTADQDPPSPMAAALAAVAQEAARLVG
ncbi:MAG: LysR family transcriptional regulator [Alphaproteobacteria bacterium]|nr:LysR family transcriptional regulator [Alphaproteobacteria bacterium]